MKPQLKIVLLIGEILDEISSKFTFTQIVVFFIALGLAIAVFIPILLRAFK